MMLLGTAVSRHKRKKNKSFLLFVTKTVIFRNFASVIDYWIGIYHYIRGLI